jgi:hypothetical protein
LPSGEPGRGTRRGVRLALDPAPALPRLFLRPQCGGSPPDRPTGERSSCQFTKEAGWPVSGPTPTFPTCASRTRPARLLPGCDRSRGPARRRRCRHRRGHRDPVIRRWDDAQGHPLCLDGVKLPSAGVAERDVGRGDGARLRAPRFAELYEVLERSQSEPPARLSDTSASGPRNRDSRQPAFTSVRPPPTKMGTCPD